MPAMHLSYPVILKVLSKHLGKKIEPKEIEIEGFSGGEYVCGVWCEGKFYGIGFDKDYNLLYATEIYFSD